MLKDRLLTAFALIPLFIAALFFLPNSLWMILMLLISAIGAWEWAGMIKLSRVSSVIFVVLLVTLGLVLGFSEQLKLTQLPEKSLLYGLVTAVFFWIVIAPIWLTTRYPLKNKLFLIIVGVVIVMPTWLAFVKLREISAWLLLALMLAVWIADSAAYFAGKRFGKHKLAPQISPGKTWEGVAGALLAVTIYGLMLCITLDKSYWYVLGLWAITVLSIMGDLLESLIKRQAGLKDSGNLLPGHGGVLDRIDGLTSTLPLVAAYIYFPQILAELSL